MLTIAQSVLNNNNQLVGVAAADITIKRLQQEILRVQFFGQSSASMVKMDGTVVADPFWDADAASGDTSVEAPALWDIHPGISEELWASIKDTTQGARIFTYERDGDTWILGRSFIPLHPDDRPGQTKTSSRFSFRPRYVVLVEARQADVEASLSDMRTEIQQSRIELIFIALGLCLAVLIIVLGLLKFTARRTTRPLREMMEVAERITKQATDDGGESVKLTSQIAADDDEVGEVSY